jgi:broad specificity phosphatase PhoE
MNNQTEDIEDIFKGIDAALRRAAQTAKKLSEENGTPFVVVENSEIYRPKHHDVKYKQ